MRLILALLICTILSATIMPAQLAPMSPLGRPPLPGTLQRGPSLTSPMFGPEFLRPFGSWGANSIQAASDDNVKGPVFFTAPTFKTGPNPYKVLSADFNGDGRLDLITSNQNCTTNPCGRGYVSVLLANGDGTFQSNVDYQVGFVPYSLASADFNGDGKLDVVVINLCGEIPGCSEVPGSFSILEGNGDGTFQPNIEHKADMPLGNMIVSDFNADGKSDIAILECELCAQAFVSIWLGNGDGTFQTPSTVPVGTLSSDLAFGDFNRDGLQDLAVTAFLGGTVEVLLGNGDGSFQAQARYPVGMYPLAIGVGDLNNDNLVDLVVGDQCSDNLCSEGSGAISVLLGNGDGTFRGAVAYETAAPTQLITVEDLNGDGNLDIAANAGGNTTVLLGDGHGHLGMHVDYGEGPAGGLAVSDFDGNGTPDLAISNFGGNYLSVVSGLGNGQFSAMRTFEVGASPLYFGQGDFNEDGNLDLAVSVADSPSGALNVLLGDGRGGFSLSGKYAAGILPRDVAAGDFNGDGHLDLITSNTNNSPSNTVTILLGGGNGLFAPPLSFNTGAIYPTRLVVGDFNRDGKLDFAVTNQQGGLGGLGAVAILLGNGEGTFQSAVNYQTQNTPFGMVSGDFNNDGKLDLAVTNVRSTTVSILLGNGDGTFQSHLDYQLGFEAPYALATSDFNRDGKADMAVPNPLNSNVAILLGNGDGTFHPESVFPSVMDAMSVSVGDFNRDGKADLLVNRDYLALELLLGNGDGTFAPPTEYPGGLNTEFAAALDLNGDGSADVANTIVYGSSVQVLLNQRGTHISTKSSLNPSPSGQPVTFTTQVAASLQHLGYAPKGMVKFWDGNTLLGIAPLSHGSASVTTSTLSTGNHKIKTTYGGDGKFNQNKADPVIQKVQ